MKTVFMFSGQGSQYIGMGKELYDNFPVARDVFSNASELLGYSVSDNCFNENDELNQTKFTQPAIFTVSMAILELLKTYGITADYLAGFSLGEYSALTASGVISFNDAIKLVRTRGIIMDNALPKGTSTMAAVMGLKKEIVEQVCEQSSEVGIISVANYNTDDQTVISGEINAVEFASNLAKQNGAKRVINLNVSGAFHTQLLNDASQLLLKELKQITFNDMKIPVISNVTAKEITSDEDIKALLAKQITHPVRWVESINYLISKGCCNFIELGPSKTLSSFVKKISKNNSEQIKIYNVEDLKSLNKTLEGIGC